MCVGSTREGIGTLAMAEHDGAEPTVEPADDSEIDENCNILMDLEMRDFNDDRGVEEDI
jgi:hypothetical protein